MLNVMFYLTTLVTAEVISASPDVPEFCPAGVLLHASKSTDMSLSHLSTLKCHRPGPGSNPQSWALKASAIPTRQPDRLVSQISQTALAELLQGTRSNLNLPTGRLSVNRWKYQVQLREALFWNPQEQRNEHYGSHGNKVWKKRRNKREKPLENLRFWLGIEHAGAHSWRSYTQLKSKSKGGERTDKRIKREKKIWKRDEDGKKKGGRDDEEEEEKGGRDDKGGEMKSESEIESEESRPTKCGKEAIKRKGRENGRKRCYKKEEMEEEEEERSSDGQIFKPKK
ncbi:hypothetical protein ANN_14566 [Periplaneta americana]|uniref:Uncharacterized protein n=1 Tax=Periplaneta americana TaxID=6978 RepID=A0ABQ8SXR4_PERAM|nr:hypothetical protein ANN_14566 [Periplaneta americana]